MSTSLKNERVWRVGEALLQAHTQPCSYGQAIRDRTSQITLHFGLPSEWLWYVRMQSRPHGLQPPENSSFAITRGGAVLNRISAKIYDLHRRPPRFPQLSANCPSARLPEFLSASARFFTDFHGARSPAVQVRLIGLVSNQVGVWPSPTEFGKAIEQAIWNRWR